MKRRKMIKQMMGIGISRNEAEIFARTYKKVIAAGKTDLFPDLMIPPAKVYRQNYNVKKFAAEFWMTAEQSQMLPSNAIDSYIRDNLTRKMIHGLKNSNCFRVEIEKEPDGYIRSCMYLYVAMPEEVKVEAWRNG